MGLVCPDGPLMTNRDPHDAAKYPHTLNPLSTLGRSPFTCQALPAGLFASALVCSPRSRSPLDPGTQSERGQ